MKQNKTCVPREPISINQIVTFLFSLAEHIYEWQCIIAPKEGLKVTIEQFWRINIADTEAVELLKEYYDTDQYGLRWA